MTWVRVLVLKPYPTCQTCVRIVICAILVCGFAATLAAQVQLPYAATGAINKYDQNNNVILSGSWYQPCTVDATCVTLGSSGFFSSAACPPNTSDSSPAQGGDGSQWANPNTNASTANQGLCGFSYNLPNTVGGTNGWHSYTSGGVQSYLNTLASSTNSSNPLWFDLTSAASLYWYNSGEASASEPYRHPQGDYGYFLSTANTDTTPGITICVGAVGPNASGCSSSKGISEIAFYWGSVDPWNKIGFCPSSGPCVYVYGNDLSGFTFSQTSYGVGAGNSDGAVVDIQNSTLTPWAYITFSSCDSSGNCNPAFEIDNLTYGTSDCTSPCALIKGAPVALPAPVPEPTSAFLLAGGAAVALRRLRRKA